MRALLTGILLSLAATSALAQSKEPVALRDFGSFHIGGKIIEITGQPVKEVVFTPGGVPAKVDPNGKYQVEQMYVQYFLPQNKKGKLPLLMWHGGGLTGVTYETTPDGRIYLKPEEECLAACCGAPMMMVDHIYHEHLTPQKIDEILDALP